MAEVEEIDITENAEAIGSYESAVAGLLPAAEGDKWVHVAEKIALAVINLMALLGMTTALLIKLWEQHVSKLSNMNMLFGRIQIAPLN